MLRFFAAAMVIATTNVADPALAQHMNAPDSPCRNPVSVVCYLSAAGASDLDLNQTYASIRRVLGPADRRRLQAGEQAWLAYRDAFCTAEYGLYSGGTGGTAARLACLDALTRQQQHALTVAYGWRVDKFRGSAAP